MMFRMNTTNLGRLLLIVACCSCAYAQAPARANCTVSNDTFATPADDAFRRGDFAQADTLYRAELDKAKSVETSARLVRTLVAEDKLDEALKSAQQNVQLAPQSAVAATALGETQYRRGDLIQASSSFQHALALDPCYGRAHYDMARYMQTAGLFASATRQFNVAHQLSPGDPTITAEWEHQKSSAPDQPATCTATEIKQPASFPIVEFQWERFPLEGIAIDMQLNGHKARFQVDTGASGIYLSKKFADSIGLKIGGGSNANAVVDTIRLGDIELQHCRVTVGPYDNGIEERGSNRVDKLADGIVGTNFFAHYLVKVDIPERKLTLSPLPARPGATAESNPATQDRYIAPEMKTWSSMLMVNDQLIVPTQIDNGPIKLMVLDTGATDTRMPNDVPQNLDWVTTSSRKTYGAFNKGAHTPQTSRVNLSFGGVKVVADSLAPYDMTALSKSLGMELSGRIGYRVLREFAISLDYRDNLIQVTYDPNHGIHPGNPNLKSPLFK
jgi:hypothetical protein